MSDEDQHFLNLPANYRQLFLDRAFHSLSEVHMNNIAEIRVRMIPVLGYWAILAGIG